jgi:hypothetical protein
VSGKWEISSINFAEESEMNLVFKTWKSCELVHGILPGKFAFAKVEHAVHALLARGGEFRCVRNVDRLSQLFGIAVVEGEVAHFVFVKRYFRRHGIGETLLAGCRYATLHTELGEHLIRKLNIRRVDL